MFAVTKKSRKRLLPDSGSSSSSSSSSSSISNQPTQRYYDPKYQYWSSCDEDQIIPIHHSSASKAPPHRVSYDNNSVLETFGGASNHGKMKEKRPYKDASPKHQSLPFSAKKIPISLHEMSLPRFDNFVDMESIEEDNQSTKLGQVGNKKTTKNQVKGREQGANAYSAPEHLI